MRFLIDFFPILLFFVAYKMEGIYMATGVLMGATVLQTGIIYALDRRLHDGGVRRVRAAEVRIPASHREEV